jgi:hypothetical membrane protein
MNLISIAVAYITAVIVLAHFFAPPGYDWTRHTISQLAAQGHENKWLMQAGFIGFGLLLNLGILQMRGSAGRPLYALVPLALYGLAILLSGIFCAGPIDPAILHSLREAHIHSVLATAGGVTFSLAILGFLIASTQTRDKLVHLVFLVAVTGMSMGFGLTENETIALGRGVAQRALYAVGFMWLLALPRLDGGES